MGAINHSDRKHALLSASGSSRWINCTPSARLEEKEKAESRSIYADEGTLAHEFGELGLLYKSGRMTKKEYNSKVKELEKHELYSPEMDQEVDKYVTYVMEQFHVADVQTDGAILMVEQKIDLTHFIEDGFGTNDSIIIADGVMEIIDLKYGKGIRVESEENSQLKLYGLGSLREHELSYDIHTVKLTIVQPRLDSISSWDISAKDLNSWGDKTVIPQAKLAYAGDGIQKAGDWCRWCKVKAHCSTLASQNMKIAKHEFKDPRLLTDKQILQVYKQFPQISDWIKSVTNYIFDEALKGKKWTGYKLVEGRSNRVILEPEKVVELLLNEGFTADQFTNSKLAGIGVLEKLVGKDDFTGLLGRHIDKPQGKPTLVLESDKRPAMGIEQAKKDFG